MPFPRIAIIGGGVSGLALRATLHKRGIPSILYERDASLEARSGLGGILDLHWETGQRAMRENGLGPAFDAAARIEGDMFRMYRADGTLLVNTPSSDPETTPVEERRPEIARSDLVKILREAAPAESIKWGHTFAGARHLGNGTHEIEFSNGAKVECDLLVGADGARSPVRSLVSPETAKYTGVTGAELYLPKGKNLEAAANVGEGTMMAFHGGCSIAAQHQGGGVIRSYAWVYESHDFPPVEDGKVAIKALLEKYDEKIWAPWLRALIAEADPTRVFRRQIYTLPVGHKWTHVPGVTLLGDAAHLAPPGGEGANLGLRDGLDLGIAIAEAIAVSTKSGEDRLDRAVADFEELMLERGRESAKESTDMMFGGEPGQIFGKLSRTAESMYANKPGGPGPIETNEEFGQMITS